MFGFSVFSKTTLLSPLTSTPAGSYYSESEEILFGSIVTGKVMEL
jgi:hypothetical protein